MLRKLRPRSAYDVMAAIAFFIAVAGGSAYAAATIGSPDIKNNAVLSRHIKNGKVKNADLAPDSVGTGKIIDGQVRASDLGPIIMRTGAKVTLAPGSGDRGHADCHQGERVISGGADADFVTPPSLQVEDSAPRRVLSNTGPPAIVGWQVGYVNESSSENLSFTPFVLCLAQ